MRKKTPSLRLFKPPPKSLHLCLLGFLACLLSLRDARSQGGATIVGSVKDSSGAVISGAQVRLTSATTGRGRETVSSQVGRYRFAGVSPGEYAVSASFPGFRTTLARTEVTVGEAKHLDLVLQPGDPSVSIMVTGATSSIDLEQGRLSALVDKRRAGELPLNGRNVYQLIQLTPGAVDTRSTVFEPGQGANLNGGRATSTGFWLDGISTKGLSGGAGAESLLFRETSGIQPNLESIQEFRIETTNFSAEYGNSSAAIVSVVSKSGTNQLHGSVFEFHRNDNLDAREFFDTENPPEFKQNQFGFSIGGPLAREGTFFFGTYEGTRIRTGESELRAFESRVWANYVANYGRPVAAFLYGNYPAPEVTPTRTVAEYLARYGYVDRCLDERRLWIEGCAANQGEVDGILAGLFGSPAGALAADAAMTGETSFFTPDRTDSDGWSLRIDHHFGEKDKFFGRYSFNEARGMNLNPRPAFNNPFLAKSHLLALNWIRVLSPTVVNEARAGLTRNLGDDLPVLAGIPFIHDGDFFSDFGGAAATIFHENIFSWADTLSLTFGKHGLKVGAEVRRNQENSEFNAGQPIYNFSDLVYLALDDPYSQSAGVDPMLATGSCVTPNCVAGGELASNFRGWRNTEIGLFINDDWKVGSNLTVNLGLRWDYYGRLTEGQNRGTRFNFDNGDDLFERVRNGFFEGPVDRLSGDDWNNFAPRLGVAWDPFGDGKVSVRSGYGIAYQSGIYNPLSNSRWNKPFYSFNRVRRPGGVILYGPQDGSPVNPTGPNSNPGARNFEGNIIAYDTANPNIAFLTGIPSPDQRDPYVQSYFVGVQRELLRDTTLEVNYVGTLGRKIIRAQNPNRFNGDRIGLASPTGEFAEPGCDFSGLTEDRSDDCALNRVNPNEGVLRVWENSVNSNYHALQVQVNRRYSNGFALNANYTWAKSLDTRSTWHSGQTTANFGQEGYSTDVGNVALDYGRSVFDARHRLVLSWLWDAPWFRSAGSGALRKIFGDWQFNGIVALQSGQPFTPYCSDRRFCDFNADGHNNDRPNTPSGGNSLNSDRLDFVRPGGVFGIQGSLADRLDFFGRPAPGTNGTLGRNTFDGPGFANFDFSVFKEFAVPQAGEQGKIQLRFEFFNLFNRPNFFQPFPLINDDTGFFGRSSASFDAREIQIGVKLIF